VKNIVYPLPPKEGYQVNPSYQTLLKMSAEELREVDNFEISNDFGKILFFGATDLRGVNLGQQVTIRQGCVEVYEGVDPKPKSGEKLNKKAAVMLTNMKPRKNETVNAC
jgi:hypothetical protein